MSGAADQLEGGIDHDSVTLAPPDQGRGPWWFWPLRIAVAVVALAVPFLVLRVTAAVVNRAPGRLDHPRLVATALFVLCGGGAVAVAWFTRRWWSRWLRVIELPDPWTAAPTPERQRSGASRFLPLAAEVAAYLGVLVTAFGRFAHFFTNIPAAGDAEGWTWLMWETGKQMRTGALIPIHLPHAMYPYSIDLLTGDGYLPLWLGGLFNTFAGPAASYNLLQVAALVSALLAGRWMAQACTSNRAAVVATACAFAASPIILFRFGGHVNLMFVFPTALIVGEVVRLVRADFREVHWIRLGAWLALAFLSSSFYLIFGSVVLLVAVVAGLATHRNGKRARALIVKVGGAFVIAGIVIAPFLVTRSRLASAEDRAGAPAVQYSDQELQIYSGDLYSALTPPLNASRLLPRPSDIERNLEISVFIGWALVGGLAMLSVVATRLRAILLASAATIWVLTLGPSLMVFRSVPGGISKVPAVIPQFPLLIWLPYAWLSRLPFLGSIRTPGRVGFALVAVAAAGLALVLGSIALRVRRAVYVAVLALVGLLVYSGIPRMPSREPLQMSAPITAAFEQIAADQTGRTVVTVPDNCVRANWASRFEIEHEHPVIGCTWFSAGIPFYSGLEKYTHSSGWASYRCVPTSMGLSPTDLGSDDGNPDAADLREMATDLDVGWIILDKQPGDCDATSERYQRIDAALRANAVLIGEDARFAVFEVPA